jgi:hypothetical protein
MIDKPEQLVRLAKKIKEIQDSNFYGKMEIDIFSGNLVTIKVSQTFKLDEVEDEKAKSAIKARTENRKD